VAKTVGRMDLDDVKQHPVLGQGDGTVFSGCVDRDDPIALRDFLHIAIISGMAEV
jgi:hypothetical protein